METLGQSGAPAGLLQAAQAGNIEAPSVAAQFNPAVANLQKEPLSHPLPQGTNQIIANKPSLDFNSLEDQLRNSPVPDPETAARLIAALVTPPPPGYTGNLPQPQQQPLPSINTSPRSSTLGNQAVVGGQAVGGPAAIQRAITSAPPGSGYQGPINPSTGRIGGLTPNPTRVVVPGLQPFPTGTSVA